GSLASPRPLEAFDCGSQSTSSVLTSAAAKDEARLMAVVVLPTPPFWLATAITRPMSSLENRESGAEYGELDELGNACFQCNCGESLEPMRDGASENIEVLVSTECSTWNIAALWMVVESGSGREKTVPRGTLPAPLKASGTSVYM